VIQRIDGNEENYDSCKVNALNMNYDIKFNQKSWPIHVPAAAVIHE